MGRGGAGECAEIPLFPIKGCVFLPLFIYSPAVMKAGERGRRGGGGLSRMFRRRLQSHLASGSTSPLRSSLPLSAGEAFLLSAG